MKIDHEKFKKELSKFYKMGYEMGFRDAILKAQSLKSDVSLIEITDILMDYYNSYPCIEKMPPLPEIQG